MLIKTQPTHVARMVLLTWGKFPRNSPKILGDLQKRVKIFRKLGIGDKLCELV